MKSEVVSPGFTNRPKNCYFESILDSMNREYLDPTRGISEITNQNKFCVQQKLKTNRTSTETESGTDRDASANTLTRTTRTT